jgi:hypothetical protein
MFRFSAPGTESKEAIPAAPCFSTNVSSIVSSPLIGKLEMSRAA